MTLRRREFLTEGSIVKGSLMDYYHRGEEAFLKRAAVLIKKYAGSYARRVIVHREGGREPYLQYKGENRSDESLEFIISITPSAISKAEIIWWGETARGGRFKGEKEYHFVRLNPDDILDVFKRYFG